MFLCLKFIKHVEFLAIILNTSLIAMIYNHTYDGDKIKIIDYVDNEILIILFNNNLELQ